VPSTTASRSQDSGPGGKTVAQQTSKTWADALGKEVAKLLKLFRPGEKGKTELNEGI